MWKFGNFSVAQISREINCRKSRSSKNAVFAILGGSEFYQFGQFWYSKSANIYKDQSSEALNVLKLESRFGLFDFR